MKKTLLTLILACGILVSQEIVVDTTSKMPVVPSFTRDNSKEIVLDSKTGLMWQDDKRAKSVSRHWNDAKEYCKNLRHDGFSDWRLPSIRELESIVDTTEYAPAINKVFQNTVSVYYWSSLPDISNSDNAWGVDFESGNSTSYNKTNGNYIRCARAGE